MCSTRSVFAALLCLFATPLRADIRYRVIDLGTVPGKTYYFPLRIDAHSRVLGQAFDASFFEGSPFVWTPEGGMTALQSPAVAAESSPGGISPTGEIVGSSFIYGGTFGTYYQATVWGPGGSPQLLGPVPAYQSHAGDVAPDGEIDGDLDFEPAVWSPDGSVTVRPYSPAFPYGGYTRRNTAGDLIGFTYDPVFFEPVAAYWPHGQAPLLIGTLSPGAFFEASVANDLNDRGTVVGTSGGAVAPSASFGFVWDPALGIRQLPGLGGVPEVTYAYGVNNAGQIVGASEPARGFFTSAVIWQRGNITDLNSLIDPNGGWFLSTANGINDRGEIVGFGVIYSSGNFLYHAFLLEPLT